MLNVSEKQKQSILRGLMSLGIAIWFSTTALAQQMQFHLLPNTIPAYTWVGLGADSNWTTIENWSTRTVPGQFNTALFNNACSGVQCNVTVNTNISIGGINMSANYVGTITQGTSTIEVGADGFVQAGGTFLGGSASITTGGPWTLSGGTFTSTSGTFYVGRSISLSVPAATFNHNSGLIHVDVLHNTYSAISTSNAQFNNLTFQSSGVDGFQLRTITGTMYVNGNFVCNGPSYTVNLDSGTIATKQNLAFQNLGCNGNTEILVNGNANQAITGTSITSRVPSMTINSTGGTVTFTGGFQVMSNFTYTAGSVDLSASQFAFTFANFSSHTLTVSSATQFNDVTFNGDSPGGAKVISGTLFVNGNLTCASLTNPGSVNTGLISAKKDVSFTNEGCVGSSTIEISGNTNQTVSGTAGSESPALLINSGGGTVTFSGTLESRYDFTYTAGTVNTGTSTFIFALSAFSTQILTVTPAIEFNNVRFSGAGLGGVKTITGTLITNGTFECSATGGAMALDTGTIKARGDLYFTNLGCVGSAILEIDGSGTQTFSGVNTAYIPKTKIVSTGTVNLSGFLHFLFDFEYATGTVVAGTSTIYFNNNSYTTYAVVLASGIEFYHLTFGGAALGATRILTGTFIVNGTFRCDASSNARILTGGTIVAKGDIFFTNSGCTGTATISMTGSNSATLRKGGSAMPDSTFVIDKSGGATVTFTADFPAASGQDFDLLNGNLNLSGYGLRLVDILTVSAGTTLTCNGGEIDYTSLTNSGTINCPGFTGYPFHWTGAGGNSNWNTAANWSNNVVPGSSDVAAFGDSFCTPNCNVTLNVNPNTRGIRILSDYTGTITQSSGVAMTIGAQGWKQENGTFLGSDAAHNISTQLEISGGSYTTTSGTLTLNNAPVIIAPAATLNHNNGTIIVSQNTNRSYDFGGKSLNNLSFSGSWPIGWVTPSDVLGNFTMNVGGGNAGLYGQINLHGNLTITNQERFTSSVIRLVGNNNQTITTSGAIDSQTSRIGRLIFDKPSGSVTFTGNISVAGIEYIQAGAVTFPASTTASFWWWDGVVNIYADDVITPGPLDFRSVRFVDDSGRTISGTMKILENLTIDFGGYNYDLNGGKIQLTGNLNINRILNTNSSTEIEFVGTTNSSVTAVAGEYFPGTMSISKTGGGSVNLASANSVRVGEADVILNSGTLNMNGFNLNIGTASGVNNILRLESGTVINRGGGTLTYESLTNNGGTINP